MLTFARIQQHFQSFKTYKIACLEQKFLLLKEGCREGEGVGEGVGVGAL